MSVLSSDQYVKTVILFYMWCLTVTADRMSEGQIYVKLSEDKLIPK